MKKLITLTMIIIIMLSSMITVFGDRAEEPWNPVLTPNCTHNLPWLTVFFNDATGVRWVYYTDVRWEGRDGTVANNSASKWIVIKEEQTWNEIYQADVYHEQIRNWNSSTNVYDSIHNQIMSADTQMNGWRIEYANYDVLDEFGNIVVENSDFNFDVVITNPPSGYKDVIYDMVIGYQVVSKDADWDRFKIEIKSDTNVPVSQNRDILEYEVMNSHWASTPTDGKYYGGQSINLRYATIGTKQIIIGVTDLDTGIYKNDVVTFAIKEFTDTNGDGRDDETGQDNYTPPSADENGSWDGNIAGSINVLSGAWNDMRTGVMVVSSMFGAIFGFLPEPIRQLIYAVFTIMLLICIIKIIRG